jgi:hypothetical protein
MIVHAPRPEGSFILLVTIIPLGWRMVNFYNVVITHKW